VDQAQNADFRHAGTRRGGVWILVRFAVLSVVVVGGGKLLRPFDDLEFDSAIWKQYPGPKDYNSPRGRMYDDIASRLERTRPTREEVLRLLGEPDFRLPDGTFEYSLGAWSGFRMDFDSMYVNFDRKGRVSGVYKVQH
jgi:hypothetical protein